MSSRCGWPTSTLSSSASAHGAKVLQEPTEYPYGERECDVEDLAGHRWQFTQTLRDVAPEEWARQSVNR